MTTPIREKMIAKVEELRGTLRTRDPRDLAARAGVEYDNGVLRATFFGEAYVITLPDFQARHAATGKPCSLNRTGLFLYYLHTADGTPLAGKWIAFRDLPGGTFYHQAYQGYSGDRLAKAIDNRIGVFERAARNLGGMKLNLGDMAFAFQALPRVPVAAIYHSGDEDFPATANILFDASASHYLPTDALAGVGSALVDRLTGVTSKDDEEEA